MSTHALHPVPRRTVLSVPLLVGLGILAGCSEEPTGAGPSAGPTAAGAGTAILPVASPTARDSGGVGFERLEDVVCGTVLTDVSIGPLLRVDDSTTILPLTATVEQDSPLGTPFNPMLTWVGNDSSSFLGDADLRVLDPATNRVWRPAHTDYVPVLAEEGQPGTAHVVLGGIDASTVTVLLRQTAIVEVQVIGIDEAPEDLVPADLDVEALLAQAVVDEARKAPLQLEHYSEAVDGSSGVITGGANLTVLLSGDVTFDPDSAALSAEADVVLEDLVALLEEYPDGGTLDITGHTDDVADEAHNLTLSQQRAQAVSDRLSAMTDLSAWTVTSTGKGETEPRVDNVDDASRAVNRRVEVVATPSAGVLGADPVLAASSAEPPEATGPSAPGPQGVAVTDEESGATVTIALQRVVRRGNLLLGVVDVLADTDVTDFADLNNWFGTPEDFYHLRGQLWPGSTTVAGGLTLLAGDRRVFPVEYVVPDSGHAVPVTELNLYDPLPEGAGTRVCVAWPDTGQDTVVVDRLIPEGSTFRYPSWRLTEVPVESD